MIIAGESKRNSMFQIFISRINWRQIVIHFIGFCFFIFSFKTLFYLYDIKWIEEFRISNGKLGDKFLTENQATDITYFLMLQSFSGIIGILLALITSVIISVKRKWFLINSLLTFILILIFYRFVLAGWDFLRPFFWRLGQVANNVTFEFLINGLALLIIALLFFFLKQSNHFIEKWKAESSSVPVLPGRIS